MPGPGSDAAAECCQVQPEGVSGSLAAERPRGHEDQTGPAKGDSAQLYEFRLIFMFLSDGWCLVPTPLVGNKLLFLLSLHGSVLKAAA